MNKLDTNKSILLRNIQISSSKKTSSSIHKIVIQFKKFIELTVSNNKPSHDAETIELANKVETLCKKKLYYYQTRFGFIKEFFSKLRNKFVLGTFTSSAQYGYNLARSFLDKQISETPKNKPVENLQKIEEMPLAPIVLTKPLEKKFEKELAKKIANEIQAKTHEVADILQTHLTEKGPNIPVSEENLDTVLNLSDQIKFSITNGYQHQKLIQELEKTVGKEKASQAWTIKGLIPSSALDSQKLLTDEVIHYLTLKVDNYFKNQLAFEYLKNKIETDLGSKDYYFNALDKVNMLPYLKGFKLLNPEIEKQIYDLANKIKINEKFDWVVANLEKMESPDLYINDEFIEKKFKVTEALEPFDPQEKIKKREQLQKTINMAFLQQEIAKKGNFVKGSGEEINLLKCLRYDVKNEASAYNNKEEIYRTLLDVVENQLKIENFSDPNKLFRMAIKECGLKARLNVLHITEEVQIEKFKIALKAYKKKEIELRELAEKIPLNYPDAFPKEKVPEAVDLLEKRFKLYKSCEIENMLWNLYNSKALREKFQDNSYKYEDFERNLLKRFTNLESKATLALTDGCNQCQNKLSKTLNLYEKWGSNIHFEIIQGQKDPNEALQDGVCWALCRRIFRDAAYLKNFTIDSKNAPIKPKDRFLQAKVDLYKSLPIQNSDYNLIKSSILYKATSVKDISTQFNISPTHNTKALENGWMTIHVSLEPSGGHALLMRLDEKNNKAWFYDPNLGFLTFENPAESFEMAKTKCLNFFEDLCDCLYSDLTHVAFWTLDSTATDLFI